MSFFDEHLSGCTPVKPCTHCKAITFMKDELGETKFAQFLVIIGEITSTEPTILDRSINELGLNGHCFSALQRNGYTTVGQLILKSKKDLLALDGFGAVGLESIVQTLHGLGLRLRNENDKVNS